MPHDCRDAVGLEPFVGHMAAGTAQQASRRALRRTLPHPPLATAPPEHIRHHLPLTQRNDCGRVTGGLDRNSMCRSGARRAAMCGTGGCK